MRPILLVLVLVAACGSDSGPGDDTPPPTDPTWHQDIAPLVAGHCQSCHAAGGIAPFPLTTYDDAAPVASMMASMTGAGLMPPFGAVPGADGCTPRLGFLDDPSLTADEIALFRAWADAGAPAGDAATAAPLPVPPNRQLEGVTHELAPLGSWTTSGESDQFICLTYDPQLAQDMWLTGIEFRPTDASVVHHAGAFADPLRASAQLAGPDGTYDCFSGPEIPESMLLGGYTPGALPFELVPGSGTLIPAGSMIVVQVHYHPLGSSVPVVDATSLGLRLTATPPARDAAWIPFGNEFEAPILQPDPDDRGGVEFRVPANVNGHTETMRIPLPVDADGAAVVWSVYPHMHYVGTRMQVRLDHDDGSSECLIDAGRYDFQWQRMYSYDGAIGEMPAPRTGDELVVTCTYDNTTSNPNVMRALEERGLTAPVDVYSGEETLDEMCIVLVGATER
jgi:hypothetical protein